jgi:hypothetical protein
MYIKDSQYSNEQEIQVLTLFHYYACRRRQCYCSLYPHPSPTAIKLVAAATQRQQECFVVAAFLSLLPLLPCVAVVAVLPLLPSMPFILHCQHGVDHPIAQVLDPGWLISWLGRLLIKVRYGPQASRHIIRHPRTPTLDHVGFLRPVPIPSHARSPALQRSIASSFTSQYIELPHLIRLPTLS